MVCHIFNFSHLTYITVPVLSKQFVINTVVQYVMEVSLTMSMRRVDFRVLGARVWVPPATGDTADRDPSLYLTQNPWRPGVILS